MRKWMMLSLALGTAAIPLFLKTARTEQAAPAVAAQHEKYRAGTHGGWTSVAATAQHSELDQIFGRLKHTADEAAFQDAKSAAYFELMARIVRDPGAIAELETIISGKDRHQPMVQVAVGALVGAGTPEAQAALVRMLDARKTDDSFLQLLVPSMGFARKPTPELEGALRSLAASDRPAAVREMAHLAVGTTAARLQAEDPARARHIIDDYDHKLRGATNAQDMSTYLSVLGNAGTKEAAQVVERYLDDSRPTVRAEALEALRRVPTAEAESHLTHALHQDSDESVRTSAAWAMSYRQPTATSMAAQAEALAGEQSPKVAKRLLDNLWDARDTTAMAAAAKSHPLAEIREQARTLLEKSL